MDELNTNEQTTATEPDYKARVGELEAMVAQKDEELSLANGRIAELDNKLADANGILSQTVAGYKALAAKTNPGVEDLISGNSIEEINASIEKAKAVIAKVKQGLEDEAKRTRVPAGAPQRRGFNLSALSPREKIQIAIGGKK